MIYTTRIKKAIRFAITTHEVDQKQKRKGKDIAYITHPLTVGLILAGCGASEEVVAAGILHDTIEDSIAGKKVTREMLIEEFGENVATLVASVSEKSKELSWDERKREALEHINHFSHDSLLVKSADILSNASELIDDIKQEGKDVFSRFNAPKEKIIQHYLRSITAITRGWQENPLAHDLRFLACQLHMLEAPYFMAIHPASKIEFVDYDKNALLECPICNWKGTAKESQSIEYSDDLHTISCFNCEKMLLVVNYPLVRMGKQ